MDIPTAIIVAGSSALVTGGIAWGGFKAALNGTKERVTKLEKTDHELVERLTRHAERLSRIEAKIDILLERKDD